MAKELQLSGTGGVPEILGPTGGAPPTLPPIPPLMRDLRGTTWFGLVVIVLFFGIAGGWAATAPISGATIASGVVSPESSRQTVQHLEGGIIRAIRVKEGDHVMEGDVLVVLKGVGARSEAGALSNRLCALAAQEARLEAERTGSDTIHFSHPALADPANPIVQEVIAQQINQFRTRRANDESRRAILEQRVAQLDDQITGYQKQLESNRRQNELIREEIATVRELYEKGYERKPRLLALQRREAELMGTEGDLVSSIARAKESIGETKLRIISLKIERMEDVNAELATTQGRRSEVEEQVKQSTDRLARTAITAPVSGTVLNIRFKTTSGVIRPGEPILDIVPGDDDLIIDGRISPRDIDEVREGLPAYVMFPAYTQRNLKRIKGQVTFVSADAFTDENEGGSFYKVKVRVDRDVLNRDAPEIVLTPGMPAEVFISTGERTLLEYLTQPFLMTMERTFRE